ncbi:MAG TPA: HD domain-containing phosphohydrolase [Armatimonadota bacterium]|nr:HD domain-containing phosphohydrolase [Armatimonadota bacterium]
MPTVLVVDDECGPREALRMILKDEFRVLTAETGDAAAAVVRESHPDAVLLDIRLGRADGIEALRAIRAIDQTAQVAMITAYASLETARLAMQLGAADYLTKPFDCNSVRHVVRELVARTAALHDDTKRVQSLQKANEALTKAVTQYRAQMQSNHSGTVVALILAIDAKDIYTREHSIRVSMMGLALGEELGMSADQLRTVRLAGLIHDIGKIGVPETVLRKEGKLTPEEWLEMKTHPRIGADIISAVPVLVPAVPGVLEHHERPDGKGYPQGLSGGAISPLASVLAVADAIDAMSSDRVYRGALHPDRILDELAIGAGTQWATPVVEAAIRLRLPRRHQEFKAPPGRFPVDECW